MGIGHNTHLGAGRLVEHPGWNLKPTVGIGTAKITAKNNGIRPVDRLMNSDLRPNHETQFRGCSPALLYNADRPHSVFAGRTPDEVYDMLANQEKLAA